MRVTIVNGYVSTIGTGVEISEEMSRKIASALTDHRTAPDGYIYRLRSDTLEWELAELPPASDPMEEDIAAEEALSQIQEVLGYEA